MRDFYCSTTFWNSWNQKNNNTFFTPQGIQSQFKVEEWLNMKESFAIANNMWQAKLVFSPSSSILSFSPSRSWWNEQEEMFLIALFRRLLLLSIWSSLLAQQAGHSIRCFEPSRSIVSLHFPLCAPVFPKAVEALISKGSTCPSDIRPKLCLVITKQPRKTNCAYKVMNYLVTDYIVNWPDSNLKTIWQRRSVLFLHHTQ